MKYDSIKMHNNKIVLVQELIGRDYAVRIKLGEGMLRKVDPEDL